MVFVVLGGLFPNAIVAQRSAEAETVEQAISVSRPARADHPRSSVFETSLPSQHANTLGFGDPYRGHEGAVP